MYFYFIHWNVCISVKTEEQFEIKVPGAVKLIITNTMEGSHSITDTDTVKHTNVHYRLHNSPRENIDHETRCYRHLSTLKHIKLCFITVGTRQGDVKSNSCVLLDARSKETQWILCSPPLPTQCTSQLNECFIDQSSLKSGAIWPDLLT